jgi:hypothetical protein
MLKLVEKERETVTGGVPLKLKRPFNTRITPPLNQKKSHLSFKRTTKNKPPPPYNDNSYGSPRKSNKK